MRMHIEPPVHGVTTSDAAKQWLKLSLTPTLMNCKALLGSAWGSGLSTLIWRESQRRDAHQLVIKASPLKLISDIE